MLYFKSYIKNKKVVNEKITREDLINEILLNFVKIKQNDIVNMVDFIITKKNGPKITIVQGVKHFQIKYNDEVVCLTKSINFSVNLAEALLNKKLHDKLLYKNVK